MTTEELCSTYNVDAYRLRNMRHFMLIDEHNKPIVAFERDDALSNDWKDVTEIKQIEYDKEVLSKEIRKLKEKENENIVE